MSNRLLEYWQRRTAPEALLAERDELRAECDWLRAELSERDRELRNVNALCDVLHGRLAFLERGEPATPG